MKHFLEDLDIKSISIVNKKARPKNKKAKSLFVKSEDKEETKPMGLLDFLKSKKSQYETLLQEASTDVEKSEKPSDPPVEVVTKAEFTELTGKFDTLEKLIKESMIEKADLEKKSVSKLNEFIEGFSKAYKEDMEDLQAKILKTAGDARKEEVAKANQNFKQQPDLQELLQKSNITIEDLYGLPGDNVRHTLAKAAKEGLINYSYSPSGRTDFQNGMRIINGLPVDRVGKGGGE